MSVHISTLQMQSTASLQEAAKQNSDRIACILNQSSQGLQDAVKGNLVEAGIAGLTTAVATSSTGPGALALSATASTTHLVYSGLVGAAKGAIQGVKDCKSSTTGSHHSEKGNCVERNSGPSWEDHQRSEKGGPIGSKEWSDKLVGEALKP